jgi:energy-coupling factor transport system ATP-binding protein
MEQGITLINVTSNMEDLLFTDYTLCLYKKIIAVYGKTMEVIKNEKVLKRIGFNLPFIYDLSIQLKLYGLIKKETVNEEKLVNEIWK